MDSGLLIEARQMPFASVQMPAGNFGFCISIWFRYSLSIVVRVDYRRRHLRPMTIRVVYNESICGLRCLVWHVVDNEVVWIW